MNHGLRGAGLAIVALLAGLGCAPKLTPEQERGYRAVKTCEAKGNQQDVSYWVLPSGTIRIEGRADGFTPVLQCLEQQGYRFR